MMQELPVLVSAESLIARSWKEMKTLQWQGSLGAKQGFSLIPLLLRNETPSWGFLRLMYLVLSVSSSVCLSETKNRVNDTNDVLFFFLEWVKK